MMRNWVAKLQYLLFSVTVNQLIAGMLGAAIVLMITHAVEPPAKRVATVDITGIVNQFVQAQATHQLPANELQQRVTTFGRQLQLAVNQVARERHVVLMVQEAAVAGAPDLTAAVRQQLSLPPPAQNKKSIRPITSSKSLPHDLRQ